MILSFPALKILREFVVADRPRHGFELARAADVRLDTAYPLLWRFEELGWLTSARRESTARRNVETVSYRLTPTGRTAALDALRQVQINGSGFSINST